MCEVLEPLPVHKELVYNPFGGTDGKCHADVGGAELEVDHGLDVRELLRVGKGGMEGEVGVHGGIETEMNVSFVYAVKRWQQWK